MIMRLKDEVERYRSLKNRQIIRVKSHQVTLHTDKNIMQRA